MLLDFDVSPIPELIHEHFTPSLTTLTVEETQSIQQAVDELGADLFVVGSRAKSRGRNIQTNLSIGKGEDKKSDIDYAFKSRRHDINTIDIWWEHFKNNRSSNLLPCRDGLDGLIFNELNPWDPYIHFSPNKPPVHYFYK